MSFRTTNYGPRFSINSINQQVDVGTTGAFEVAVPILVAGASAQAAAPTTSTLKDGQFSVTSISLTSATLAYRSGLTVYHWLNTS